MNHSGLGGTEHEKVKADMVFYETPNGGAVFSVGSICYPASLPWTGYDNNIARLTTNVLRRFADPNHSEDRCHARLCDRRCDRDRS